MHRTRQTTIRPIAAAGGLVVLGLAVWGLTRFLTPPAARADAPGGPPPQTSTSTPPAAAAPTKLLATDSPAPRAQTDPPPLELNQGRATPDQGNAQSGKPALGHTPGAPAPGSPATNPNNSVPANPGPANPAPPPPSPAFAPSAAASSSSISLTAARQKVSSGDPVAARLLYSEALRDTSLSESDRATIRAEATKLNDDLVFSSRVATGDPFAETYKVQGGDSLVKISRKLGLAPDYRFLKRINGMSDEHRLNEGQKLKVMKAPFHAVVTKSAFRLDVYMGPGDKPDQWVYVRSFPVGLGAAQDNQPTPVGTFIVKRGSKLVDPPWINPKSGKKFSGHDPENPIGKFWVGLEGTGDAAQFTGYGIHGTIEPDSIGQQKSMGCVRMRAEDIAMVFEMLGEQVSVVRIQP